MTSESRTMQDLREECVERLDRVLDGREIDLLEQEVRTPHMLGIAPIGTRYTEDMGDGTLLDPAHDFWTEYEKSVATRREAAREVESAIRSLREDDTLEITMPHGEEAEIVYCEINHDDHALSGTIDCPNCGHSCEISLEET